MAREIGTGTVLVKSDAALPKDLRFEGEPYVAGWKMIADLDGYELERALQKTGWTFFCLAGEIRTTVFGIDRQSMLRRAVERLLARGKSDGFNSLEITQIASVGSERFPLVRYVTVSGQWRHIQESLFLRRGTGHSEPAGESDLANQSTRIADDRATYSEELAKKSGATSILNL